MLLVMLQEEHLSNKKPLLLIPKSSIPEQVQEAKHGNHLNQFLSQPQAHRVALISVL